VPVSGQTVADAAPATGAQVGASVGGPIGAAVGAAVGYAIRSFASNLFRPERIGPKKRRAFEAAGGVVKRGGRYFFEGQRIGVRGARRVAATGSVLKFPKRPGMPPSTTRPPPPPRQPGAVEQGVGVGVGASAGAAILASLPPGVQWVWNQAQQRWEARGDIRKGPRRRYKRRQIPPNISYQRDGVWSGSVPGGVTLPTGQIVRELPGGPASVARWEAERKRIESARLEDIRVTAKYLPVPAIPTLPVGYRIFKRAATAAGFPGLARYYPQLKRLAPLAVPLLLNRPGQGSKPKKRDSLTPANVPGVGFTPSYQSFTSFAPQPALALARDSRGRCKPCPKPKKRGKKKPRTVCYSGTFTERASGLSKSRRKQVPCR